MPYNLTNGQRLTISVAPQASVTVTPNGGAAATVTRTTGAIGAGSASTTERITAAKKYIANKTTPALFEVVATGSGSVTVSDPVIIDEPYDPSAVAITGGSVAGVAISGGSMNNTPIGATTPSSVRTSNLGAVFTDSTGTPGNVTNNSPRGRVRMAAGASAITVTNSLVSATSTVIAIMRTPDGAATEVASVLPAAGSFVITTNGATTGTNATIDFLVVN